MTHENQFGMFIHWGVYALTELQEQAIARYAIPREEYEALKDRFDPVAYDPEKWVLLAKEAGMKYLCFTAKHHDGFCMWDTKYTDYNIMNTPYGKDVLGMLAEACRRHGLKLSLYYSNPDWHHPYGYNPASTHQWCAVKRDDPDVEIYKDFIKKQITELLTNYGEIYTLFWDIPPRLEDPSINELVRRLQPHIYINDRGFDKGDFSTPEREYQAQEGSRFTRMTEACNSLGAQSWGYSAREDFYSMRHVITAIDRIMAMGGSYLLNVGPNAKGEIPEDYAVRLRRVGDWYRRMEGCLESAEADEFDYEIQKDTCIVTKKNEKSYFHFYNGTRASAVAMARYPSKPARVRLLNTGKELPFAVELLPEYYDRATGRACEFLHIWGIPVDDLASEAVVLEIEWGEKA